MRVSANRITVLPYPAESTTAETTTEPRDADRGERLALNSQHVLFSSFVNWLVQLLAAELT